MYVGLDDQNLAKTKRHFCISCLIKEKKTLLQNKFYGRKNNRHFFFSCHYKNLEKQRTFEVQFSIEVTFETQQITPIKQSG